MAEGFNLKGRSDGPSSEVKPLRVCGQIVDEMRGGKNWAGIRGFRVQEPQRQPLEWGDVAETQ